MPQFKRKPATVEAAQYTGTLTPEISTILQSVIVRGFNVNQGDWLVKESDDVHLYSDRHFRALYEPVE